MRRKIKLRNNDVIYAELSYKIYGLCFEAQNRLGRYLNEKQFCDYMETLFKNNNIGYKREKAIPPSFEGERNRRNIPDFIIEDLIIFDAKSKLYVSKQDYYQMQRYLNSYNKKLGIIVNFRDRRINPRRVLNTKYKELIIKNEIEYKEMPIYFSIGSKLKQLLKYS